ncbi:MAG: FAD:protein FMN transferase [Verrucomicrobiales bacterium]
MSAPQRREFVAPHMGTLWRLVFFHDDADRARVARDDAWDRLTQLDARLSDFRPESELSRLARDGTLASPSDDLRRVLAAARTLSEATDGAFDITVGPVVRLWRTARREKRLPSAPELAAARALVGWQAVEVHESEAIFRTRGGSLDLGGIAKGFAQDEVLQVLRERHGLDSALVDAGGGVSVGAPPPGQSVWSAAIEASAEESESVTLGLVRQSLATSGDSRQFVEIEGVRYSHIVDPLTGLGMTERMQASVVAAEGATADALATAFCVMGEEKSRAFLRRHAGAEASLRSVTADGRPRLWQSRGLARLLTSP